MRRQANARNNADTLSIRRMRTHFGEICISLRVVSLKNMNLKTYRFQNVAILFWSQCDKQIGAVRTSWLDTGSDYSKHTLSVAIKSYVSQKNSLAYYKNIFWDQILSEKDAYQPSHWCEITAEEWSVY